MVVVRGGYLQHNACEGLRDSSIVGPRQGGAVFQAFQWEGVRARLRASTQDETIAQLYAALGIDILEFYLGRGACSIAQVHLGFAPYTTDVDGHITHHVEEEEFHRAFGGTDGIVNLVAVCSCKTIGQAVHELGGIGRRIARLHLWEGGSPAHVRISISRGQGYAVVAVNSGKGRGRLRHDGAEVVEGFVVGPVPS